MADRPGTRRAQARAEITEQIKQIARGHLAVDGANLSLRAVARDLGVSSSAVYRYFASRDELLTALIIEGYDALGDAVETAEAAVPRRNLAGRWAALCHATRDWARENPHEYALLYGSPVPGYAAPMDTVPAAQRTLVVGMRILADAVDRGLRPPTERLPAGVRAELTAIAGLPDFAGVPVPLLSRALSVWALLFGTVSFEVFGRYTNAITDLDGYFEHQVKVMSRQLGLLG